MGNTELMLNPVFPIYTKFFIVSRFVSTYIWKVGDCSTYLCQFLILESERQLLIRIINEYSVKIKPQRELINQKKLPHLGKNHPMASVSLCYHPHAP